MPSFLLFDSFPTHLLETVVLPYSLAGGALYLLLLSFQEFKPVLKDLYMMVSFFFLEVDVAHFYAFWNHIGNFAEGHVRVRPLLACGLSFG